MQEQGFTYVSNLIGRTYEETVDASNRFDNTSKVNSLIEVVYYLDKNSIDEFHKKSYLRNHFFFNT